MTSVYSPLGVCLETQMLRNSAYGQILVRLGQLSSDSDRGGRPGIRASRTASA